VVRVIKPVEARRVADAPKGEHPIRKKRTFRTHCRACADYFKETKDFKYTRKDSAEFSGLYVLRDVDGLPYRIYFCEICGSIFAAPVRFKRCPYMDVIIEQDSERGLNHYVTCLEPDFPCDLCRRDLAPHHWFCNHLDVAPEIPWEQIYNTEWWTQTDRHLIPEQEVMNPELYRQWKETGTLPDY